MTEPEQGGSLGQPNRERAEAFLDRLQSTPMEQTRPRAWVALAMLSRTIDREIAKGGGEDELSVWPQLGERAKRLLEKLEPEQLRRIDRVIEDRKNAREVSQGVSQGGPKHISMKGWETRWGDPSFNPPWATLEIDAPLRNAQLDGWLGSGRAIDLGCGEGQVAAWLAEQGFESLGIDLSEHAIARARTRWEGRPGLRFLVHDMTRDEGLSERFDLIVDRGCLHGLVSEDAARYAANLAKLAKPGARVMVISHHRFSASVEAREREIIELLGPRFRLVRTEPVGLEGPSSPEPIPGAAYRFLFT